MSQTRDEWAADVTADAALIRTLTTLGRSDNQARFEAIADAILAIAHGTGFQRGTVFRQRNLTTVIVGNLGSYTAEDIYRALRRGTYRTITTVTKSNALQLNRRMVTITVKPPPNT